MAVYTHLGAEALAQLIAQYEVGDLLSAKGIAEGVSNSNWLIETSGLADAGPQRFILTMYERRIDLADLPYFLGLLDHLAAKGCPVPRTIHDRAGASFRMEEGKAVALIEFLPGVSPTRPTAAQARAVGEVLARMHLASRDFPLSRANAMNFAANAATLKACGAERLATIHPDLPAMLDPAEEAAALDLSHLPQAQIHSDLFPDNVLMLGSRVTGLIDFYFACTDLLAYDVAVCLNAWCFEPDYAFNVTKARAMLSSYDAVRHFSAAERAALPVLCRGAALRFLLTRLFDWTHTPAGALVTRKDPLEYLRKLRFFAQADSAGALGL